MVAATLGLLLIAAFYEVAIDTADVWWKWLVALPIATAVALVGLAIIYVGMDATAARTATGWLGMFAGRVPPGYGPGDGNLGAGVAGLVLFVAAAVLGVMLYRKGVGSGQLNWAIEGLALVGSGAVFGLAAAVPRLYFACRASGDVVREIAGGHGRRHRGVNEHDHAKSDERSVATSGAEGVTVLLTAGLLGVALSMCTANTVMHQRLRDGVATMPYADWLDGCVDADATLPECAPAARLTLIPREARPLRLEVMTHCKWELRTTDGDEVQRLDSAAKQALGIEPSAPGERERIVFVPTPRTTYEVLIAASGKDVCAYSVRYLFEPTGRVPRTGEGSR